MLWNTFSPIARITQSYYEITPFNVDSFSFIYFLAYIIFVLPASWIIYRFPLNFSIIIGGGIYIVSTLNHLIKSKKQERLHKNSTLNLKAKF
jgi:fucose permease